MNPFDSFEFKRGELVCHRGRCAPNRVSLVVVERILKETTAGVERWYTVATEGFDDIEVREIEIFQYVAPIR